MYSVHTAYLKKNKKNRTLKDMKAPIACHFRCARPSYHVLFTLPGPSSLSFSHCLAPLSCPFHIAWPFYLVLFTLPGPSSSCPFHIAWPLQLLSFPQCTALLACPSQPKNCLKLTIIINFYIFIKFRKIPLQNSKIK